MRHKTTKSARLSSTLAEGMDPASRTIYLFDEITDQSAFQFVVAMRLLDASPGKITVVLSSGGGYDSAGWAIYDTIRAAQNQVRIEGYGHVQSMAVAVLQAGDERVLAPNCRFMVHMGSVEMGGDVDLVKLTVHSREAKGQCDRYIQTLAQHSGKSLASVRRVVEAETFLSARQAVALGFADYVLDYEFPQR